MRSLFAFAVVAIAAMITDSPAQATGRVIVRRPAVVVVDRPVPVVVERPVVVEPLVVVRPRRIVIR